MKTTPRLKTTATVWATATLWTLTGCPTGGETEEPDAAAPGEDAGGDVSDDAGAGEDVGEDTGDAGGDVEVSCETTYVSPRTLPTDARDARLTWRLECDGALKPEALEGALTWSGEREREGSPVVEGVECLELEAGGHGCVVTTKGLNGPSGARADVLGEEQLAVTGGAVELSGSVRWRLSAQAIQAGMSEDLVERLPVTFARRGMGVRVMQGASAPYVAGAMWNQAGDGIEMFGMDTTSEPPTRLVHDSLDASMGETIAHGFETLQREGGGADSVWWGFDAAKQQFRLILIAHDGEGNMSASLEADDDAYTGSPIAAVLDVEAGTQTVGGEERLSLRALVLKEDGKLAELRLLAGGESMNRVEQVRELDVPGGSRPTSAQVGFVQGVGARRAIDDGGGHVWLSLDGVKFSLVSLDGAADMSTVELGTNLELEETFVGEGEGGQLFVWMRGEDRATKQDATALFQIERDAKGSATRATRLEVPVGVDLRPAPKVGEESVWLEAAVEAAGAGGLEGIWTGSRTLGVHVEGDVMVALGRWPWSWRDKLEAIALGRWPWDWRERKELRGSLSVVGQWDLKALNADGEKALTSLRPAVAAGAEAQSEPTGLGVLGFAASGSVVRTSLAALRAPCADGCFVRVGEETPGGFGVHVGQGSSGLVVRVGKYGDILIDGVPLEFDLIGPPVLFDLPGGGASAIAPVDHPQATHAVWAWGAEGEAKGSGLLSFDAGDGEEIDADVVSGAFAFGPVGGEEIELSFGPVDAGGGDPDTPATYAASSVAVPLTEVLAALSSRSPVTIDLKGRAQARRIVATREDASSARTWAPAEALEAEPAESSPGATVLAALTDEQASRPIRVRQDGGGIVFETVEGLGGEGDLTYAPIEGAEVTGAGAGGPGVMYAVSADFTGRIKRVRIRKRRVGSGFRSLGVEREEEEGFVYELISEEIELPAGSREVFAEGQVEVASIEDYNGDGLEDVSLRFGGHDSLAQGETDSVTVTYVAFGDGEGGMLEAGIQLKEDPKPVDSSGTELAKAKNRRVEFILQ